MDRLIPSDRLGSAADSAAVFTLAGAGNDHPAILCFSHLRWDFVFQRPQHLMTRFAATRAVYYIEEPVPAAPGEAAVLDVRTDPSGVEVVTPRLPDGLAKPIATGCSASSWTG